MKAALMARPSQYPAEFREQAVELVRATGRPVAEVAWDLQISHPAQDQAGHAGVSRT